MQIIEQQQAKIKKSALIISAFLTMLLMALYMPTSRAECTQFNRLLGIATANNYNVSKVIRNFFLWYLMVFPIVLGAIYLTVVKIFNKVIIKDSEIIEILKYLNGFIGIACFPLIVGIIGRYSDKTQLLSPTIMFTGSIVILTVLYIALKHKVYFYFNDFKWSVIVALIIYFPVTILCNELNIRIWGCILYMGLVGVIAFGIHQIYRIDKKTNLIKEIKVAGTPLAFSIFIMSLILELSNVLNQYGIFITQKTKVILIMFLIILLIGVLFTLVRKNNIENYSWEKYYYTGIVISFAFLMVQPPLQRIVHTDFFEQANGAVSVGQFFAFGEIPLIESHGAHFLSDYLLGIVYGIINQDTFGALFSPYNGYSIAIAIIIMYFVLKQFFNKDFAFIFTMLFPIVSLTNYWIHICMISLLALTYLLNNKEEKVRRYYSFWIVLALSVLYQGDMGLAYGIGAIISLILVGIIKKEHIKYKQLIISFISIASIFIGIFSVICLVKDINILDRVKEILEIMQKSNQNWAINSLGNTQWIAYSYVYFFIPLSVIALLIYLIYAAHKGKIDISTPVLALIIALGIAYLVNLPRVLVRHSLVENMVIKRIFTATIFIPLAFSMLAQNRKKIIFSGALFSIMLFSVLIENNQNLDLNNLFDSGMNVFDEGNITKKDIVTRKVKRVDTTDEMKAKYVPLINELNRLLEKDETFVDFSNQTLIYALAERNNPVFINQSPGLLSGDYSQEQFINQVEMMKDKVPLAILPVTMEINYLAVALDGIPNSFRYYKVSEYLYRNYEPLEILGDFAIWCRKDMKSKYASQLNYEEYNVEKEQYEKLTVSDATATYDNERVQVLTGGIDPIIEGIDYLIKDEAVSSETLRLGINYQTSSAGQVQLFYRQSENEEYTENNSFIQNVEGNGWVYFDIPYTVGMKLRLDPPNYSEFNIYKISIGNQILYNYTYGNSQQLHTYDLGDIPYLWGTYDEKEAYRNEIIKEYIAQDNFYSIDIENIDRSQGKYLALTIQSNNDGVGRVKYGTKNKEGFTTLNNFNFNIKQGKNIYLIRISTDSYWYSNVLDTFKIECETDAIVESVQLLQGD